MRSFVFMLVGMVLLLCTEATAQVLDGRNIAAGYDHTVTLKSNGTVWTFGANQFGQLGDGTTINQPKPVQVVGESGVGYLTDIVAVAAGYQHTVALKSDGTVWVFGGNSNGQLGDGTTIAKSEPVQVVGENGVGFLTGIVAVAAGESHTVALKNDGTVWAFGGNSNGQLGNGTTIALSEPVQVVGENGVGFLTDIIAVTAGGSHTVVLKSDGTVWTFGSNLYGQLGDGTNSNRVEPVQVVGENGVGFLTDIVAMSAGGSHTVALKSDGTVWTFGNSEYGQTGSGGTSLPARVVGEDATGFLTDVVAVAAGETHTVVLKNDGVTLAFGNNRHGQIGYPTTINYWNPINYPVLIDGLSGTIAVAAGGNHTVALTNDGTLQTLGANYQGQLGDGLLSNRRLPTQIHGLNDGTTVSAGIHSMVLKNDGYLWAFGGNWDGQLGNGTTVHQSIPVQVSQLDDVMQVSVGVLYTLALKENGTVWAMGNNNYGQFGNGTYTVDESTPLPVQSNLSDIAQVAAGETHGVALKNNGTLWTFGSNWLGQLGDGTTIDQPEPVQVVGENGVGFLTDIIAVAAGYQQTVALKSDGTVWAFGDNSNGQLGDGTTIAKSEPVQVVGENGVGFLTGIVAVAAGNSHTVALKSDGTVWTFGGNANGQLGDGTTLAKSEPVQVVGENGVGFLTDVVAVAAGYQHTVVLKANGTVLSFGANNYGQLGDGTTINRMIPVAVGGATGIVGIAAGSHTMAVKEDGSISTWGYNYEGQLGLGTAGLRTTTGPVFGISLLNASADVTITSPTTSSTIPLGTSQVISASMSGGISIPDKIFFYHHGVLLGEDDSAPFEFNFTPWTWGSFEITAIGVDSNGAYSARSEPVIITVPYDHDDNKMPDWWELEHFNQLGNDPAADPDNDGLTNLGEYFYGSDPNDADSDDDTVEDGPQFAAEYGSAVTDLASTGAEATANSVTLTWVNAFEYETSFLIQASTDGGVTWFDVGAAASNAMSAVVNDLNQNTNYQFRVVSVSPYGNSTSTVISQQTLPGKPAAPASLAIVSASEASVSLSWQDISMETGYIVEGRELPSGAWGTVATEAADTVSSTVLSLSGALAYEFRVKSVNNGVESDPSNVVSLPTMPLALANVTVQSPAWNQVRLEWELPVDATRTKVRVKGYFAGNPMARLSVDLEPGAEEFVDGGLNENTAYEYQVASVNARGESVSVLLPVTTMSNLPSVATGVVVQALEARATLVSWTDNASNETGYVVERSATAGGPDWVASATLPANSTSYEDRHGLQGATTYYYRVRAVNEFGSTVSAEVSQVTLNYPTANHAPDALGIMPDEIAFQASGPVYANFVEVAGGATGLAKDGDFINTGGATLYFQRRRPTTPPNAPALDIVDAFAYQGPNTWQHLGAFGLPAWAGSNTGYGTSVMVSGNKVFVGAPDALNQSGIATGLIAVIEFSGLSFATTYIEPASSAAGDRFGYSISVEGDRLLVGAPGKDKPDGGAGIADAGAVLLYEWSGSAWILQRTEWSEAAQPGGQYGHAVAMSGGNYVVGAPYEDCVFPVGGIFYNFTDAGTIHIGRWSSPGEFRGLQNVFFAYPEVQAKPGGLEQSHFGYSVAIDRQMRIAVGRPDSSWVPSDNMEAFDRGNVMLMHWNGKLGEDYVLRAARMTDSTLAAGSRFGEYIKMGQHYYSFGIRSGVLDGNNIQGAYAGSWGVQVQPGQLVGGVEVTRRAGDLVALDEDGDPLTFSIASGTNPMGAYFEIGGDGVLRAKESLSTQGNGFYFMGLTVSDDRGGELTEMHVIEVAGGAVSNDEDNDGIDDDWELANGLDPENPNDALSDHDMDGYSALEEYQRSLTGQTAGVDPNAWDIDPNGDIDGDGIPNKHDSNPHDGNAGALQVIITSPVDQTTL